MDVTTTYTLENFIQRQVDQRQEIKSQIMQVLYFIMHQLLPFYVWITTLNKNVEVKLLSLVALHDLTI